MNIFIHHRDLRIHDNTTLIKQSDSEDAPIVPIFVFPPEQIDDKINKYFSHNLVQFMIESLKELDYVYRAKNSKLHFFKGHYTDILDTILRKKKINSIGFNMDYSPYAKKRDEVISKWAKRNGIKIYCEEDHLLQPLRENATLNRTGAPYKVFTPFKRFLMANYKVAEPDSYNSFKFQMMDNIGKEFNKSKLDTLYEKNYDIMVHGGRREGLKMLRAAVQRQKGYGKMRDILSYNTTHLSAFINFNVISIREVYHALRSVDKTLISELYWRDFYYNILYFFPHVVGNAFNPKFDKVKWSYSKADFAKWCDGQTGFPIVDAAMNQLNTTGYMHNRARMIVASFLTKDLLIDWRWGERYFATQLTDYNISANNGGWQWCAGTGADPQPYFRIFNPWNQSEKYDPDAVYIKKWLPELAAVPAKDIHRWHTTYEDYPNVKYPEPMLIHEEARERALKIFAAIK